METNTNQNIWNFIFTVFFLVVVIVGMWILYTVNNGLPTSIPLFDLAIIVLATFRLTRLFVYDKIAEWFRNFFWDRESYNEDGTLVTTRRKPPAGPRRTLADLLGCPWCFGIWAGFFVTFFYFLIPDIAWFAILVLAVAAVGSFIQLLANMIGWRGENLKKATEKL